MPKRLVSVSEALELAAQADRQASYWYSKHQPEMGAALERTARAWRRIARQKQTTRRYIQSVA